MAGDSSIGTAWIQIKPSLKGVTNDLRREFAGAESEAQASSNKITGIFSGLGGNLKSVFSGIGKVATATFAGFSVAATAGFAGMTKSAISAYADWEQLYGGIETLFKDSADTVDAYAQQAFKTAGLSANEYMETVTGFSASLLQSLSGDTAKAADYANQALIDMSDNANKMGTDMERIQDAYQGFAKQNYTMLDNLKLGYGGTKTEMERLLADATKLSGVKYNIDSFADITKAIHVIQDNLNITGTTALEAETTISGSLNQVKASWKNMLAFFGGGTTMAWSDIFPAFIDSIKTFAKNIEPVIHDVVFSISNLFQELAPLFVQALPSLAEGFVSLLRSAIPPILQVLPDIINSIVDGIVGFISDAESVSMMIDGFIKLFVAVAAGAGRIVTAIIPLLPAIIGQIIGSFANELSNPENSGPILAAFGILFGATLFKTIGSNVTQMLKDHVGGAFTKFFQKDMGSSLASKAGNSVKQISSSITSAISGIGTTISTAFKTIGSILTSAVNAVVEPLKAAFKGVGEAIAGFFKAFSDPMIAVGAAMFAVAAAAIAAAIFLIGSAVGAIMPTLTSLFNDIMIPMADFVVNSILTIIDSLTNALVILVNSALIPLGEFMTASLIDVVNTVTDAIVNLSQNGIVPLISTLSNGFMGIIREVSNLITGTLHVALEGIANIVGKVGEGFEHMGNAIKTALDGVNGILSTFRDLILGIADAIVAVVALATGHSIDYGKGFAHITKAATGGRVIGVGTETSDSNLYALSDGEYVIRAAAARKIGYDNLDSLNQDGSFNGGTTIYNEIKIEGYNKDPEALANIVSRKIAFNTQGVY